MPESPAPALSPPCPAPRLATVLAAVLIVRDEARSIVRCLESVRPWVDAMIVVDTGSADDTARLARQCGAQVHHMKWPDDFSAARNHALDLSDADWNLVIDADEWLRSGGENLRKWCNGPARLGAVSLFSSFDLPMPAQETQGMGEEQPLPETHSLQPRLLPRGVRYQGRIHEQPLSSLPVESIAVHFGHDGYRDARIKSKRHRNESLLMRELRDDPANPYILYQLGKNAEAHKDYPTASDYYDRAFALTPPRANWRHSLLTRHLHCLGQTGKADIALDLANEEMENWQDSPDFFFVVGNLALDRALADPTHATGHWLPLAMSAWERCLVIGDRPDLEGSVQGRGSHLARHNLHIMRAQLGLQDA